MTGTEKVEKIDVMVIVYLDILIYVYCVHKTDK